MHSVVCGIDESGSHQAVTAAVNYCRENGTSLRLVGIVRDKLSDSTRGAAGERVRRSKTIRLELDRATADARAAGVSSTATLRAGNQIPELLREAEAIDAIEVFYVRSRGRLQALITRRPRRELVHLTVGSPIDDQLAAAA